MKVIYPVIFSLALSLIHVLNAQKTIQVIKDTNTFTVSNLEFISSWDDKLSYSKNIGHYGGIAELKVYKDNNYLHTINAIKDHIALGYITFTFDDFNLDGYLDFTVPLNEKFPMYYLFDPKTQKYQRAEDWDYLRDYKVDETTKIITTNSYDYIRAKTYQIDGLKLIEITN